MKALARTMMVFALVSSAACADDLLDAVLVAPLSTPAPTAQAALQPVLPPRQAAASATPVVNPPIAAPKAETSPAPRQKNLGRRGADSGPAIVPKTSGNPPVKTSAPDSAAKSRSPGGFMAGCVGCFLGRRAALDYNDGKHISSRECAQIFPCTTVFAILANGLDGFNGVTRSQMHEAASAYY